MNKAARQRRARRRGLPVASLSPWHVWSVWPCGGGCRCQQTDHPTPLVYVAVDLLARCMPRRAACRCAPLNTIIAGGGGARGGDAVQLNATNAFAEKSTPQGAMRYSGERTDAGCQPEGLGTAGAGTGFGGIGAPDAFGRVTFEAQQLTMTVGGGGVGSSAMQSGPCPENPAPSATHAFRHACSSGIRVVYILSNSMIV